MEIYILLIRIFSYYNTTYFCMYTLSIFYIYFQQAHDSLKLLRLQRELEEELGGEQFVDMSLQELMYELTKKTHYQRVKQIKKDFKVPDKRYEINIKYMPTKVTFLFDF